MNILLKGTGKGEKNLEKTQQVQEVFLAFTEDASKRRTTFVNYENSVPDIRDGKICTICKWETERLAIDVPDARYHF